MLVSERSYFQNNDSESLRSGPLSDHFECDLLLEAKRGNQAAFGELCQRHVHQILRIIKHIARNREDAEDALQEAMLRAFLNLHQFDGRSRFSTWFTRIAINAALMILRKDRTRHRIFIYPGTRSTADRDSLEIADPAPGPDTLFAEQEKHARVKRAVSSIRPGLQTVVELRYLHDCSMEEIALELGVSVAAAKGRLFHARTQLRKQMTAEPRRSVSIRQLAGIQKYRQPRR